MPRRLLAALAVLLAVGVLGPFVVLRWSTLPDPAAGEDGSCAGRSLTATRELRGMWITTINNSDWPSRPGLDQEKVKAEYRSWLDLAQRLRFNAVFVHVRPSGDAFWPSTYAPWSQWLTGHTDGRDPGWDPLKFMIEETHARNLEFHAWFNPYKAGQTGDITKLAPSHPLRRHPRWAVAYPKRGDGSRLYYDPGHPEARRFVEDSILDPVTRYDLDGVHFDDFFYPYKGGSGEDFGDNASFARYGEGAGRGDWRRSNVNTFIREMGERIKAAKPWVKFGVSPFGIWRNKDTDPEGSATRGLQSYDAIYADTRLWVRKKWVDYIAPQLYWHIGFDIADYATLLPWWSRTVAGTGVQLYIGQADYRIGQSGSWRNPAQLTRQLALNRRYRVDGSIHFSASQVRSNRLGGVSRYVAAHYGAPALPPTLARLPGTEPAAPVITRLREQNDARVAQISTPAAPTGSPSASASPGAGTSPLGAGASTASAGAAARSGGEVRHATPVTLSWRTGTGAPTTSFAVYRVDESANRGGATLVATVRATDADRHTWTDSTVVPGRRYAYCVTALDRVGAESTASAPARFPYPTPAATSPGTGPPGATATASGGASGTAVGSPRPTGAPGSSTPSARRPIPSATATRRN